MRHTPLGGTQAAQLVRVAAMTLVLGVLRAGGDRLGVLRIA